MEDVINSIKRLASNTDDAGRKETYDRLQELSQSIETPDDTLQRLMYMVGFNDLVFAYLVSLLDSPDAYSTYTPQRPALVST